MADSIGTVFVDFLLNDSKYKASLKEAEKLGVSSAKNIESSYKATGVTMGNVASGMMSAFKQMAAFVGVGLSVGALASFTKEAIMTAARVETLGIVITQVGRNAGYTKVQMDSFVEGTRKMGITTQAAMDSVTKMAQANLDLTKASTLARISQDAAVIGNTNSSAAFERMIWGIKSGQVEILRTMGINVSFERSYADLAKTLGKSTQALTEQERTTARMNAVITEGAKIQGVYEASLGAAGKQLQSMKRFVEELTLGFGQLFSGAFTKAVFDVSDVLKDMNKQLEEMRKNGTWKEMGEIISGPIKMGMTSAAELLKTMWILVEPFLPLVKEIGGLVGKIAYGLGGIISVLPSTAKAAADAIKYASSEFFKDYKSAEDVNKAMEAGQARRWAAVKSWWQEATGALIKYNDKAKQIGKTTKVNPFDVEDAELGEAQAILRKQYDDAAEAKKLALDKAATKQKEYDKLTMEEKNKLAEIEGKEIDERLERKAEELRKAAALDDQAEAARIKSYNDYLASLALYYENIEKEEERNRRALDEHEKKKLEDAKKLLEEKAKAERDVYEDLRGYSEMYYAGQQQLVFSMAERYRELGVAEIAIAEWVQRETEKIELKKLKASGNFIDGLKAGLQEVAEDNISLSEKISSATKEVFNTMTDALTNFCMTGKLNFRDFSNSIIRDMIRVMIQSKITGPLAKSISGLFGTQMSTAAVWEAEDAALGAAMKASMEAPVMHKGGMVGASGFPMRSLHAFTFANAPRLHNGLAPDEYPAILQKGERVTSAADSRNPQSVRVEIINQSGEAKRISNSKAEFNAQEAVVTLWLDALDRNSFGLATALGR